MAHGGANVPGVSGMELQAVMDAIDELRNGIITGEVSAPLTTQDGTPLIDENGNALMASRRFITQSVLDQLAAQMQAEIKQQIGAVAEQAAAQVTVSAQTLTAKLETLMDDKINAHDRSDAAHPTHISVQ